MSESEPTPTALDPIELSESRLRGWAPVGKVAFAILTAFGFLVLLATDVFIVASLISGALTVSAGLGATLALVIVLPIMTLAAAWLFWVGGIKSIADLRTRGEFSRTRSAAFTKADRRFGMIALFPLIVIPFVPILAVLD